MKEVRSLTTTQDRIPSRAHPLDNLVCFTNTYPLIIILDNEIHLPGYSCVRSDRLGKVGGGCLAYVRDGIPYRPRPDLGTSSTESCVVEISRPKCKRLLIWTIYRAPDLNMESFIQDLDTSLSALPQEYPTNRSSKITALHPFYPWLAFLHNNPFACWFSHNIYLFAGWLSSNSRPCWENYFIPDPGKTIQTNRCRYWETGETQFCVHIKIICIFPPTDFWLMCGLSFCVENESCQSAHAAPL